MMKPICCNKHCTRAQVCILWINGFDKNGFAMAGSRTRVNCLEGSYANHYTTDASYCTSSSVVIFDQYQIFSIHKIEFLGICMRGPALSFLNYFFWELNPSWIFTQYIVVYCIKDKKDQYLRSHIMAWWYLTWIYTCQYYCRFCFYTTLLYFFI